MNYFIKRSQKWSIEPEEILLDASSVEKTNDSKLEVPIKETNFNLLFIGAVIVLLVLLFRTEYLQVQNFDNYSALSKNNKIRNYPIIAKRGIIYDRNMATLVTNNPSFDLVVVPADLPRKKNEREKIAVSLASLVGMPEIVVSDEFSRMNLASVDPTLIKADINKDLALLLETKINDLAGVKLQKNATRGYLDGQYFSHVIGYVDRVTENILKTKSDLSNIDYVGILGVEASYDKYIRGVNGRIEKEISSTSRLQKEREVKGDDIGEDVVLTIDAELQKKLTDVMTEKLKNAGMEKHGAAAVAMNPKTGEILALVSLPSYNNNIFASASLRSEYQDAVKDDSNPFFNRAISGQYPPGSSIKPFMATAALEEKVVTRNTQVLSTGAIAIQNQYNPEIVYTYKDWKAGGHGLTNVIKAISDSVNTFFYAIGGGYRDIKGLGSARINKYLSEFGFSEKTGIDLAGEGAGVIPNAEWKEKNLKEQWVLGDVYNMSIGQGNLLVTPLQLARGYAALVNGGKLLKPFIVKSVLDKDKKIVFENKPEVVRDNFIDPYNIGIVLEGMRATVTQGTAKILADLPVHIAGKTGTAQAPGGKTHAWFSSFAPYEDPSIVLIVLVENGGEGSAISAPISKEVYQWYFKK